MCEKCQVREAAAVGDWQKVHDVAAGQLEDHDKKSESKTHHASKAGSNKD